MASSEKLIRATLPPVSLGGVLIDSAGWASNGEVPARVGEFLVRPIAVGDELAWRHGSPVRARDTEVVASESWVGIKSDSGSFVAVSRGAELSIALPGTAEPSERLHLLVDTAMPAALSLEGRTLLHCSCLAIGQDAVLVLGESGSGKSTLAAAWVIAGGSFVCDDWCAVAASSGGLVASCGSSAIRLRRGSLFSAVPPNASIVFEGFHKRWCWFAGDGSGSARQFADVRAVVVLGGLGSSEGVEGGESPDPRVRALFRSLINVRLADPEPWGSHLAVFRGILELPWVSVPARSSKRAVAVLMGMLSPPVPVHG